MPIEGTYSPPSTGVPIGSTKTGTMYSGTPPAIVTSALSSTKETYKKIVGEVKKTDPSAYYLIDREGNNIIVTTNRNLAISLAEKGIITRQLIKDETGRTVSYIERKPVEQPAIDKITKKQTIKKSDIEKLEELHSHLGIGAGLKKTGVKPLIESAEFKKIQYAGIEKSKELETQYERNVLEGIETKVVELQKKLEEPAKKPMEKSTPFEIMQTGAEKIGTSAEIGALGIVSTIAYIPKIPEMVTGILATSFAAGQKIGRGEFKEAYETVATPIGLFISDVAEKPSYYAGMTIGGIIAGEVIGEAYGRKIAREIESKTKSDVIVEVTERSKVKIVEKPIINIIKEGEGFKAIKTEPYETVGGKVLIRTETEIPKIIGKPEKVVSVGVGKTSFAFRQKPVSIEKVLDINDVLNPKVVSKIVPKEESALTISAGKGYSTITGVIKRTKEGIISSEKVKIEPMFLEESGTKSISLSKSLRGETITKTSRINDIIASKDIKVSDEIVLSKAISKSKKGDFILSDFITKELKGGYVTTGKAETIGGAKVRIGIIESKKIPRYEIFPPKKTQPPLQKFLSKEVKTPSEIKVSETLRELQKEYRKGITENKINKEINELVSEELKKQIPIESTKIAQQSIKEIVKKESEIISGKVKKSVSGLVVSTTPRLRVSPFTEFKKSIEKEKIEEKLINIPTTKEKIMEKEKIVVGKINKTIIDKIPKQGKSYLTETEKEIKYKQQPPLTPIPVIKYTPKLPKLGIPPFEKAYGEYRRGKAKKKSIILTKYKPSLAGVMLGVKTRTKPSIVTGVEIRPYIVSGIRRKARRKKR